MREIVIILCAAIPVDADTTAAIPFAAVSVYEGPAATVDAEPEAIDAEYEVLS